MTNYEFYKAVAENAITEEVIAKAQAYLAKQDEAKTAKSVEQAEVDACVAEALRHAETAVPASEIAVEAGITTGKATAALKRLRAIGAVTVIEGKPNLYRLA